MVRALIFDVFGTVVDWRGSITREVRSLASEKGIRLNAGKFANDWRAGYQPAMQRVRQGDLPWLNIDALHRLILNELKQKYKLDFKINHCFILKRQKRVHFSINNA